MTPAALSAEALTAAFPGSPQHHSHASSNIHRAPTQQGLVVPAVSEAGEGRQMTSRAM